MNAIAGFFVGLLQAVFSLFGLSHSAVLPPQTVQVTQQASTTSVVSSRTTNPIATSTSETDSMSNWQTYTNSQYGFSFKYPPSWTMYQQSNINRVELSTSSSGVQDNLDFNIGNFNC